MADSYNFFSDRPVDYGAQYIASGLQNLGSGIAGGLQDIAAQRNAEKNFKMKQELEKQMKIDEEDRLHTRSIMDQWASAFPDKPPPTSADGKPNLTAMMGALGNFDRVGKPLQEEAGRLGVERPTVEVPGVTLPRFDATLDGPLGGSSDTTAPVNRPASDAEFAQAVITKKNDTAAALKAQELQAQLAQRNATQAAQNRQDIKVMLASNPAMAKLLPPDWEKLGDNEINGAYPAIKGAAANWNKTQEDRVNQNALRVSRGLPPLTDDQSMGGAFASPAAPATPAASAPAAGAAAAPAAPKKALTAAEQKDLYVGAGGFDPQVLKHFDTMAAAEQKVTDQQQHYAKAKDTALQTVKGMLFNIDRAQKIIDSHPGVDIPGFGNFNTVAGPIAGALEDNGMGGEDANNLKGALDSIAGANMMSQIGDLKAASPTGSTGLSRILLPEATAMSNQQGLLKSDNPKHGAQRQSKAALTSALSQTRSHALTIAANSLGLDPSKFSDHDRQALNWALINETDPKAQAILQRLGYKGD